MVKKALADGSLIASRYQNYLKLLSEIMQKERNYK
jgi:putative ribosome biogenesis GTPase RsgA